MMRRFSRWWLMSLALLPLAAAQAQGDVCVVDDIGREVCLDTPAERIAALSPGATELTFAAGAGERVVAVVAHSDFPPAADNIPSVGSHARIDLEALVGLAPTLVVGWSSGNPAEQLETLESLGMAVFYIEPQSVEGVASAIERLARLAGTQAVGRAVAEDFRRGMALLEARYSDRESVTTFYQVWDAPLMSVNDNHLIGQLIAMCGGDNVFGDQARLVPRLNDEAVLAANPEIIIAGGRGEQNRDWLTHWAQYPHLDAVAKDHLFFIPPSLIQRPTPRLLEGTQVLCEKIDRVRQDRETKR
ncbi:ABC transporter substrate-binding protein [Halomonas alkaliantarctica]|nr:ABC transporter substrate-binding protein [Halomonas alkaliantarctica]